MACAKDGKITSFYQCSPKDAPLPIHWTARAEPPKKRTKRGPDRQRSDHACCPAREQFPRFRLWSGTRSASIQSWYNRHVCSTGSDISPIMQTTHQHSILIQLNPVESISRTWIGSIHLRSTSIQFCLNARVVRMGLKLLQSGLKS